MRLFYNPDLLFKHTPKEKREIYFNKILDLSKAIDKENVINRKLINKILLKKGDK